MKTGDKISSWFNEADWLAETSTDKLREIKKNEELMLKDNSIEDNYDEEGNASHYDKNRLNAIIKFERIYGTLAVMTFCEINADKYRERIGKKDNQPVEQELMKIKWYEEAALYFYYRLKSDRAIEIDNTKKEGLPWRK